jgi:mRNA-degrading endonuclease toxin of MazEF toxin-antitoxin module
VNRGECALSFDNVLTVPKTLITERITSLGPAKLAELCRALNTAVDC